MEPTEKMLAQLEVAKDTLKKLEKYSTDSIVAGGFPRDFILRTEYDINVFPKDLDIYVKYTPELKNTLTSSSRAGYCYEITNQYKGLNNLDSVYQYDINNSTNIVQTQIILINTDLNMEDYVRKYFDLSICMATYDGFNFKQLPDFTKTVETKNITFNDYLGYRETEYAFRRHAYKITTRLYNFDFKYEGYNPNFTGTIGRCKLINRNKLSEKMIKDYKILYKTTKYYYYDEYADEVY